MSESTSAAAPAPATQSAHAHGVPQPAGRPASAGAPQVQRQFVNFAFYKLDPAFRRLGDTEKQTARAEFLTLANQRREGMMCLTYSTVGMRPEIDFLLWRIGDTPDRFQDHSQAINKSRL